MATNTDKVDSEFTPREYQVELLQKAKKKNIIVCSGTGTGKTFISVLLIKELQHELMAPFQEGGKRTIFISKTVPLVQQQAEVLDTHLSLSVGKYSGDMGVDFWDKEMWKKEFITNEILVMTSQILVNLLSQSILDPNQINLVIIDECHHAVGGDPVTQIMMRLNDFNVSPRILGLTAAVLNGKSKLDHVEKKIRQLEVTLGAVVETPNNQLLAATFATNPNEQSVVFNSQTKYSDNLLEIVIYLTEVARTIPTKQKDETFTIDNDDWFLTCMYGPNVKLSHVIQDLIYVAGALGLWCAYEITGRLLTELEHAKEKEVGSEEILNRVQGALKWVKQKCIDVFIEYCDGDELNSMKCFTSVKVERLVEILRQFNDQDKSNQASEQGNGQKLMKEKTMRGIVFVDRRVAAWMLSHHLNKLAEVDSDYSFLKTEPVMGHGADPSRYKYASLKNQEQQKRIRNFRKGECNLLIATRVVEEGMDIPTCNLVIRFDAPKDFRSYVQSKGRARSKESFYILLLDKMEKEQVLNDVKLYDAIEKALYKICHDRLPPTKEETQKRFDAWVLPTYYASENRQGPCVSSVDAIGRVNWYCQLLPRDQLTVLSPIVLYKKKFMVPPQNLTNHPYTEAFDQYDYLDDVEDIDFYYEHEIEVNAPQQNHVDVRSDCVWCYKCAIKFPLNSPIKDIVVGNFMPSKKLAKQSVALEAVKRLHEEGELNERLLPIHKDPTVFLQQFIDIEEDHVPKGLPQPGCKSRRQKYEKKVASVLKNSDCSAFHRFYLYKISVRSKPIALDAGEINYGDSCFGIISGKELFEEMEAFPLYSKDENIWVKVHLVETRYIIDEIKLALLKNFQVNLFEKLLRIISGMFKPLAGQESHYLVAPLLNDGSESNVVVDWKLMQDLDHFHPLHGLLTCPSNEKRRQFIVNENDYNNAVVIPAYDDPEMYRLYLVNNIETGAVPLTNIPDNNVDFVTYYKVKHNVQIQHLDQPLLGCYQVRQCVNLLPPKARRTNRKQMMFQGKERNYLEFLIPELCVIVPITSSLLRQAVMLPSILYRFNSLCLVKEIGHQINETFEDMAGKLPHAEWSTTERACQIESFYLYKKDERKCIVETEIEWSRQHAMENEVMEPWFEYSIPPASILLKALTPKAANDVMNLERLESLGDSFLKYATSIYLFCEHNKLDEGRLTMARSIIVSNSHLYHLAKQNGLAGAIQNEIFSPHYSWVPPHVGIDKDKEQILLQAGIPFNLWKHVAAENLNTLTINEILEEIQKNADRAQENVIPEMGDKTEIVNNFTSQLISDKSVADCVESLIGAHLLYVGPHAALQFLNWLKVKIFPRSVDAEEITCLSVPKTAYYKLTQSAGPVLSAGLDMFQRKIGYEFKDISFLVQAMTHPSYFKNLVTDCYQRLEFLGDALLDYLVTWQIYKDSHNFDPGQISDLRSALVNNETFARLAVENHYDRHLKELNPQLFDSIRKFKQLLDDEKHSGEVEMNLIVEGETKNEEEIEVPKALGDIFESVAGAIYLDSGCQLDVVWDIYSKMLVPLIDKYSEDIPIDPVRDVYELFPKAVFTKTELNDDRGNIIYKAVLELTPGLMCEGYGKNSKLARRSAAKNALRHYKHRAIAIKRQLAEMCA